MSYNMWHYLAAFDGIPGLRVLLFLLVATPISGPALMYLAGVIVARGGVVRLNRRLAVACGVLSFTYVLPPISGQWVAAIMYTSLCFPYFIAYLFLCVWTMKFGGDEKSGFFDVQLSRNNIGLVVLGVAAFQVFAYLMLLVGMQTVVIDLG